MATTKKTTARTPKADEPLRNEGGQIIAAANLNITQADDEHCRTGQFCDVVAGEHAGRYGVLTSVSSILADGTPDDVIVHTRDDADEDLTVNYEDCRPALAGRR